MILTLDTGDKSLQIDTALGVPISIPLEFNGPQPSAYGVSPASAAPLEVGSFVGSVARGGSANCFEINLIPHCQGTHTESISHIVTDKVPIPNVLGVSLVHEALLISVAPESGCTERYQPGLEADDLVISASALRSALEGKKVTNTLVIRTLPNDGTKCSRNYSEVSPPFFSNDAMELILSLGIEHLLVDFPSVDRAWDEGKLSNHRIFWNVSPGVTNLVGGERLNATITEMVFVPQTIVDSNYVLSIQVPPLMIDAAPSRVLLYPINSQ